MPTRPRKGAGTNQEYNSAIMGFNADKRLGPYQIQSPLGAGGMGEVYLAVDTRLDRTVAIKVLPSHLSSNPDLRTRFEREARAISGLQHPNICVLHDIGCQDGIDFLVMEYLEGETLSTRLARKPLSCDEAMKISIEIADALEKAHRSGIVHRDLKPGNVMLTKAGAKLMDFGLAKLSALAGGPSGSSASLSSMATMAANLANAQSPVTVAGTMIGTIQYMSPEQIQSKEADTRSDIFAFGAMLYEMVTGKRAFEGKSQLSVASAILEREPELISKLKSMIPPALEQVVQTCLAKEPDDRFQNAHDLKLQLQWIAGEGSHARAPAVATSPRKTANTIRLVAMASGWLLAIAAAVLAGHYSRRMTETQRPVRASIEESASVGLARVVDGPPVLSPDSQTIAFLAAQKVAGPDVGGTGLGNMIYLRRMTTGEVNALPGTDQALFPFWSPDGQYLGFFADGKLKKVSAAGGPPQVLCDAPAGRGGAWSGRGTIVFAPRIAGPLQAVSDGGGSPVAVTPEHKEDINFTNRNPYFLPDGKHFLFLQRGGKDAVGSIYAGSLEGGEPKQILADGSNVAFSSGYLFYLKDGTLTAQAFDPGALRIEGKPITIADAVEYYNPRDVGYFSVSGNVLVYRRATPQNRELAWLDLSGKELDHWAEPGPYTAATFSPGSQIAVLYRANPTGRGDSLWLADTQRKTVTRLTADSELEQTGVVAGDGNSVFIASTSGYTGTLVRRWLTASGKEEKLLDAPPGGFLMVRSVSRDGRYIFFSIQDPKTSFDIYYTDLQGPLKLVPLLNSPYGEYDARLSPDNKWLAYTSNETGKLQLYVTSFPEVGSKWQISSSGITANDVWDVMDWSADGKNLSYQQGDKIYSVDLHDNGGKLDFSAPKEIGTVPPNVVVITILPDGKRVLVARPLGDSANQPMQLVLNWQQLYH